MKKIIFLAVLTAMTAVFTACGPSVKKNPFPKTPYATISLEGSGKFGVINTQTGAEILPQIFDNIGYYYSGYFRTQDSAGVQLFVNTGKNAIPHQEQINAQDGYFDFSSGKTKGFYFIKTDTIVSGEYETMMVQKAGDEDVVFVKNTLCGIISAKGETIIPQEYELLVFDGENYNVAKSKNPKRPMIDSKGIVNWNLAEAKVLDKSGKLVKKLTAVQAKKALDTK